MLSREGGWFISERTERRKDVRANEGDTNSRLFFSFRFSLVPDVGHFLPFTNDLDTHIRPIPSRSGAQR